VADSINYTQKNNENVRFGWKFSYEEVEIYEIGYENYDYDEIKNWFYGTSLSK